MGGIKDGYEDQTNEKAGADVLIHAEHADQGTDRMQRVSAGGHGYRRERLLFYLEWLSGPSEDRAVQDGAQLPQQPCDDLQEQQTPLGGTDHTVVLRLRSSHDVPADR